MTFGNALGLCWFQANVDMSIEILYPSCMMKIELVKIEKFEVEVGYVENPSPVGIVSLIVDNKKKVDVVIHPCGELDFEVENNGRLTDEEFDGVLDFINSDKEVDNAFPNDEFE